MKNIKSRLCPNFHNNIPALLGVSLLKTAKTRGKNQIKGNTQGDRLTGTMSRHDYSAA